jgi:protein involved in sex pheromone biosynthesis
MKYCSTSKMRVLLGAVSLCFIMSCGGVQDEGKVDQKAIESGKTAKLIIKREKNILSGIAANVNVYINETPRGYVSNGEERSFDFYPTESGLVNIRLESSLASSGRATEKVLVASKYLDSSWHTNYTYEEKMKASAGDEFEYFCTFNPELFVRKVEKEIK